MTGQSRSLIFRLDYLNLLTQSVCHPADAELRLIFNRPWQVCRVHEEVQRATASAWRWRLHHQKRGQV